MRLYNQLEEWEIDNAIQQATEILIGDLIAGKLELGGHLDDPDDMTPEELKGNKVIKSAIDKIKNFETSQEKIDFVIGNEPLMSLVHSLAHELIKGFYYLDYGDRVMFAEDYAHNDEECPECQKEREQEALEIKDNSNTLDIATNKRKKHNIN